MTADEHAHMQELEGLVKRYRARIVELKQTIAQLQAGHRLSVEPDICSCESVTGGHVVTNASCPVHGALYRSGKEGR